MAYDYMLSILIRRGVYRMNVEWDPFNYCVYFIFTNSLLDAAHAQTPRSLETQQWHQDRVLFGEWTGILATEWGVGNKKNVYIILLTD